MPHPYRWLILTLSIPALMACTPSDPPSAEAPADATAVSAPAETTTADAPGLRYPATRAGDVVDIYHGVEVADPYRWLEQDVRESDEVAAWVAAQNEVTDAYLDTLSAREPFAERLQALWNYERFGSPSSAAAATSSPATTACRTSRCCSSPRVWTPNRGY